MINISINENRKKWEKVFQQLPNDMNTPSMGIETLEIKYQHRNMSFLFLSNIYFF